MHKPMTVAEYLAAHPIDPDRVFKPVAWYNADGDQIEAYFDPAMAYAEQLTPYISLFRSFETKEIVGVQIHGVEQLIATAEERRNEPLIRVVE